MTRINEQPTESQYKYVQAICEELEIEMPQVFTKRAYSDFIDTFKNEYKRSLQRYDEEDEDDYE